MYQPGLIDRNRSAFVDIYLDSAAALLRKAVELPAQLDPDIVGELRATLSDYSVPNIRHGHIMLTREQQASSAQLVAVVGIDENITLGPALASFTEPQIRSIEEKFANFGTKVVEMVIQHGEKAMFREVEERPRKENLRQSQAGAQVKSLSTWVRNEGPSQSVFLTRGRSVMVLRGPAGQEDGLTDPEIIHECSHLVLHRKEPIRIVKDAPFVIETLALKEESPAYKNEVIAITEKKRSGMALTTTEELHLQAPQIIENILSEKDAALTDPMKLFKQQMQELATPR